MTRLRRIFLRECQAKIRRIVGCVTNFCLVLSKEKASKMSGYFFKDPYITMKMHIQFGKFNFYEYK